MIRRILLALALALPVVALPASPAYAQPIGGGGSGQPGPVGINMRGAWSNSTAYAVRDGVTFGGSTYYCLTANTNSQPPSANWLLVAAAGTNGTNGTNGSTWRQGAGVPSNGTGVDGDFYLRTSTDDVYWRQGGTYNIVANILGATGPAGASNNIVSLKANGVPDDAILANPPVTYGTDGAAAVQTVVNNNPGKIIVVDTHTSLSTHINLPSSTYLVAADGCGFVMRQNSNTCMFKNSTPTYGQGTIPVVQNTGTPLTLGGFGNTTIDIHGGTWIGNGTPAQQNQPDHDLVGETPSNISLSFFRGFGVQDVRISDVNCLGFGGIAVWLCNADRVYISNSNFDYNQTGTLFTLGASALQVDGPCSHVYVTNCQGAGSDDLLAWNPDDGGGLGATDGTGGPGKGGGLGNVTDCAVDGFYANNHQRTMVRILSAKSLADNLSFKRLRGSAGAILHSEITAGTWLTGNGNVGRIYFDDVDVQVTTAPHDQSAGFHFATTANLWSVRNYTRQNWGRTGFAFEVATQPVKQLVIDGFHEYDTTNSDSLISFDAAVTQAVLRDINIQYASQITNTIGVGASGNVTTLNIDGMTVDNAGYLVATASALTHFNACNLIHTNSSQAASFNFGAATTRFRCSNWDGPGTTVYTGTAPTSRGGDALTTF